jgi:DNA adenine methylase
MDVQMTNIKPVQPPAPYLGGKSKLAKEIVNMINQTAHSTYAECFVGMGGVFFRREFKPKAEIINDYSRDVATLFRVLEHHYVSFMDELKWKLTSRAEFEKLLAAEAESLTDMQRAARFLYLQKTAFGGKISGRNFGVSAQSSARFDVTKLGAILEDVHERLSGVTIECLDYKEFIRRYDHAGCLFYLDPPYFGCEEDYGKNMFSREEFDVMAGILKGIKGRFILSINDTPEIRETFKNFHMSGVNVTYTVNGANQGKFGELIIMNYEISALLF